MWVIKDKNANDYWNDKRGGMHVLQCMSASTGRRVSCLNPRELSTLISVVWIGRVEASGVLLVEMGDIRHRKTLPGTPQLNDVTKRMNRTLFNKRVKYLLSHVELPFSIWSEVLSTIVHVLNLSPCLPLQYKVPQKIWSGKNVSYDNLHVFGFKTHLCIFIDERPKLDKD